MQLDEAYRVTYMRRGPAGDPLMSATYQYDANGRLISAQYNNLTYVSYDYDAAGRLTLVHHKKLPGTTLLKLEYAYTDNSLVETITESDAVGAVADVTFGYDDRGRLVSEQRVDYVESGRSYHLEYEYDQGGNRTKKIDLTNSPNKIEVEYEYDVDPPDPNPYTTWSNRLMKYETFSVTPAQQEMGVLGEGFETLGGGFWPPGGEQRVLQSTTYYYYNKSQGNVEYVVTKPNPNPSNEYSAVRLSYANNGRAVSFALGETWKWDGDPEHYPTDYDVVWAREFRYDGARQRYLNRELDADALEAGSRVALSDVWSDYDGNAIYGDFEIDGQDLVELASYEPGLGKVVDPLGSPAETYYHTNMIGTTRFMSDAAGSKIEPAVYTAFGERIDGTNHRYGYAGSSGYQAHDEMPFLHVGHRYYDPATGRFLQRNPIGILGGRNVYDYALSSPLRYVDPTGLPPEEAWDKVLDRRPGTRPEVQEAVDTMNLVAVCASVAIVVAARLLPKLIKPKPRPKPYPVNPPVPIDPDLPSPVYPDDDPVVPSIPPDLPDSPPEYDPDEEWPT